MNGYGWYVPRQKRSPPEQECRVDYCFGSVHGWLGLAPVPLHAGGAGVWRLQGGRHSVLVLSEACWYVRLRFVAPPHPHSWTARERERKSRRSCTAQLSWPAGVRQAASTVTVTRVLLGCRFDCLQLSSRGHFGVFCLKTST